MQNTLICEPNQHVSASMHHHGAVLFHAGHGQLFTTNRTGAEIWRGLEQRFSDERIAEDLSRRYELPLDAARTYTSRFIAQLVERRLVDRRPGVKTHRTYAGLVLRALFELLRYDVEHLLRGFGCIRNSLLRQAAKMTTTDAAADPEIDRVVCDAVLLATCLYWKRVLCLQRSVCATRLLRAQGLPARLVIGYREAPFFSHAWVEIGSRVVNDSAAYRTRLRVLHAL